MATVVEILPGHSGPSGEHSLTCGAQSNQTLQYHQVKNRLPDTRQSDNSYNDFQERSNIKTIAARIDSFLSLPFQVLVNLRISPHDLAEAGYSYDNGSGKIKCRDCHAVFSRSNDEAFPLEVHKKQSPKCRFIRQKLTGLSESDDDDESSDDDDDDDDDDDEKNDHKAENFLVSDSPTSSLATTARRPSPTLLTDKNTLKKENQRLNTTCRKCKKEMIQILFLPCRHHVTCEQCADQIDNCNICDAAILGTVRTYFG